MNSLKKVVLAATMAIAGFSTAAHATLIGDTITATGLSLLGSSTMEIGSGVEFSADFGAGAHYLLFNFDASTLTITLSSLPSTKYEFANLGNFVFSGFDDRITGLTVASNSPQFSGSVVDHPVFDAHSITLDFSSAKAQNAQAKLMFNITTTPDVPSQPEQPGQPGTVPEPATLALLGLGLLGVVASRRKSGKSISAQ